jgi:hypothetical protein
MKTMTSILVLGAATLGVLSSTNAHARYKTDSLAGPGDITTVQSALTRSQTDGRTSGAAPYVTHNTRDWVGNDRWGAGYYVYGYSGTSPGGWSIASNYFSADARANHTTNYSVFNSQVWATADAANRTSNVYANAYAFGVQVRNVSRGGAQFNSNYALSDLGQLKLGPPAKFTYDVFGVSVTAEAQLYANAKQTVSGRVWHEGITATLDQNAGVYVKASAYASVIGGLASGGISIENLKLLGLHLPLASTAKWQWFSPAPNACVSIAYAGGRHSAELNWLSGRIVIWGKLFWGAFKDEYEIASWEPKPITSFDFMNYGVSSRQVGNVCFPAPGTPPVVP